MRSGHDESAGAGFAKGGEPVASRLLVEADDAPDGALKLGIGELHVARQCEVEAADSFPQSEIAGFRIVIPNVARLDIGDIGASAGATVERFGKQKAEKRVVQLAAI